MPYERRIGLGLDLDIELNIMDIGSDWIMLKNTVKGVLKRWKNSMVKYRKLIIKPSQFFNMWSMRNYNERSELTYDLLKDGIDMAEGDEVFVGRLYKGGYSFVYVLDI